MPYLSVEYVPIDSLVSYDHNSKRHPESQIRQIANSIEEFGNCDPVGVWTRDDGRLEIVEGHGRLEALKKLGEQLVPIIRLDFLTDEQRQAYSHVHNQLTLSSGFDEDILRQEIERLSQFDWSSLGFDLDGICGVDASGDAPKAASVSLSDRFIFPPFSVLNARSGEWQQRKREWLDVGIASDLGRDAKLAYRIDMDNHSGTSVFDPVLCELMYAWHTREGDEILDPFAGGSVRGVVSALMKRTYTGIDLRQEQIDEDISQSKMICNDIVPSYICGDSAQICEMMPDDYACDFVFTCPPYGDLEVYSDMDGDLSNMDADDFDSVYTEILRRVASFLKDDRFAAIVVGDYRDHSGCMRDLRGITIRAMESAGVHFYNEYILVTACGTLPMRAGKQFDTSRKNGKTHQNVLVFIKGDPKKATSRLPKCQAAELMEARDNCMCM